MSLGASIFQTIKSTITMETISQKSTSLTYEEV